jgi:hypothetical protein
MQIQIMSSKTGEMRALWALLTLLIIDVWLRQWSRMRTGTFFSKALTWGLKNHIFNSLKNEN